jgi:hypothetical protein
VILERLPAQQLVLGSQLVQQLAVPQVQLPVQVALQLLERQEQVPLRQQEPRSVLLALLALRLIPLQRLQERHQPQRSRLPGP